MWRTNYPVSLFLITPTSKELVAVVKALTFETSGLQAPGEPGSTWELTEEIMRLSHFRVYDVRPPQGGIK